MKKILVILFCLVCIVGCSCNNDKASDAVEDYLNEYKSLSDNVLASIDNLVESEDLTDEQKDIYKEILKRQYRDMIFIIENESYDGDTALVTVKITVYDLYLASKNASTYLNNNQEEFITDGVYDTSLYMDYKLNEMKSITDTVSYNIVFTVNKVDGNWVVAQPDDETLEKIHGIYDYENN